VNRRLVPGSDLHSQRGALQAAIDEAGINNGKEVTPTHFIYNSNAKGDADAGAPGYLLQGDILQSLAPVLTARGDTFVVRAYGDVRDSSGQVRSKATCEAIVQRYPEKMNMAEHIADPDPASGMGRRFEVVGFRWIKEEEL
jgi:hypothetical protein